MYTDIGVLLELELSRSTSTKSSMTPEKTRTAPAKMAGLSRGHRTRYVTCHGVALAPDVVAVVPPELQPGRSEPAPAASSPAAAPCLRKPRRDSPPARLSSVQPSRGCIPGHLFRGRRVSRGRQSFLTEHSVNLRGTLVRSRRARPDT